MNKAVVNAPQAKFHVRAVVCLGGSLGTQALYFGVVFIKGFLRGCRCGGLCGNGRGFGGCLRFQRFDAVCPFAQGKRCQFGQAGDVFAFHQHGDEHWHVNAGDNFGIRIIMGDAA